MRWMMIGLFVSLGALLIAVVGLARHIHLHHKNFERELLTPIEELESKVEQVVETVEANLEQPGFSAEDEA